ncbi:MAG: hypothetical protein OXG27_13200 [Chloroflexi bacterium]|nr:hypothetical protein [Chloroflexota bacterium]
MAKEVHLTVLTLSGKYEGKFDVDQKLQDVIDKTFLTLDIKPAPGEEWQLLEGDVPLNPQATIEDKALADGTTLRLAPKDGGGGCRSTR